MKNRQFGFKSRFKIIAITVLITVIAFSMAGCSSGGSRRNAETQGTVTVTVGDAINISSMLPASMSGNITWTSSAPNTASVSSDGTVTAVSVTDGIMNRYSQGPATGNAVITASCEGETHSVSVITTTLGQTHIMELPPMKDQFARYFMIGNIYNPHDVAGNGSITPRLTRHYNALTAENAMKPQYIAPGRSGGKISYNFSEADKMVNAAIAAGIKVVGHTLLWHSQIPDWQKNITKENKETALAVMKQYIKEYVSHFAGRIYSWDVINEVFPDGGGGNWKTAMRGENPWFKAIGADFVYEAFLAAREADPSAILYYKDYNLDNSGKAGMVRNMVREVNERYAKEFPNANRLLIEGIGMQSHHNTGVSAANIRATINLFRPLGVKLSVSELDILGQGWGEFSPIGHGTARQDRSTVSNSGILTQARLYGEYMKLYVQNADIIERVTMWGVLDNQSWRSAGLPQLFDPDGMAKPAYYSFTGALE